MGKVTPGSVLEALKSVDYESTGKDVVALGLVGEPRVDGERVLVTLELPSPGHPRATRIADRLREVVEALPGVARAEVEVSVRIREGETRKPRVPGVSNVIAVASGKGGVGKSTVAVNLAVGLGRLGTATGLVDLDIYGPSTTVAMGFDEEAAIGDEHVLVPADVHGVRFLSMGQIARGDRPVVWRGPMLHKMVTQLLGARWGDLDYLVLDLPPGTGDVQLTVTQGIPVTGAIVVTTPQEIALIDARKGLTMFRDNQVPILGVVENMASYTCPKCGKEHSVFGDGGGRGLAARERVPLLARLPLDPGVGRAGDAGRPAVLEEGPLGDAFRALVAETAAELGTFTLRRNPFQILS